MSNIDSLLFDIMKLVIFDYFCTDKSANMIYYEFLLHDVSFQNIVLDFFSNLSSKDFEYIIKNLYFYDKKNMTENIKIKCVSFWSKMSLRLVENEYP
jgi:hypothetical protein